VGVAGAGGVKVLPGGAAEPVGDGARLLANDRNGVDVRLVEAPSGPGVDRGAGGGGAHGSASSQLRRRGRRTASRCLLVAFAWWMWRREFM
jgi:hypothetical protein